MMKRSENVTSPAGTSTRVTRLPKRSRYERIGREGSEAILSGVSRSESREGWMLSWRIIGVAAGHSKATSNPASISMGRSSKSHDPAYASPSAWGRADGGGWERFAPDSSPREDRGDYRATDGFGSAHAFASL